MSGVLYVVATPIGNLEDVTARALRVLREVDVIACEDTRRTRGLLAHFDIHTPTVSYYEHNKLVRGPQLLRRLAEGGSVALVTDAGTPGISDPGFMLVRDARAGDTGHPPRAAARDGAAWRVRRRYTEMRGPEMAPHTPQSLVAPRRSRGAPRPCRAVGRRGAPVILCACTSRRP